MALILCADGYPALRGNPYIRDAKTSVGSTPRLEPDVEHRQFALVEAISSCQVHRPGQEFGCTNRYASEDQRFHPWIRMARAMTLPTVALS